MLDYYVIYNTKLPKLLKLFYVFLWNLIGFILLVLIWKTHLDLIILFSLSIFFLAFLIFKKIRGKNEQ